MARLGWAKRVEKPFIYPPRTKEVKISFRLKKKKQKRNREPGDLQLFVVWLHRHRLMKYFTRDKSSPVKETSKKQLLQRTASSGPGKHREPFSMWLRKKTVIISLQDEPELIPQIWREEQNWSSPNSIQNAECPVPFAYGRTTSLFMPENPNTFLFTKFWLLFCSSYDQRRWGFVCLFVFEKKILNQMLFFSVFFYWKNTAASFQLLENPTHGAQKWQMQRVLFSHLPSSLQTSTL